MNSKVSKVLFAASVLCIGILVYLNSGTAAPKPKKVELGAVTVALKGADKTDLSEAVVYLTAESAKPVSPSAKHPRIVQGKDGSLTPHVLPVVVGTKVDFVSAPPKQKGKKPAGKEKKIEKPAVRTVIFSKPGSTLIMDFANTTAGSTYVVVLETPYIRQAAKDGSFHLAGLPVGTYQARVWHPAKAWLTGKVKVVKDKTASLELSLAGAAPKAPKKGGGTISGKIKARGVRSPEDVLVYIERVAGTFDPPANPVRMNQKNMVFVPHVLPVVKGTTVSFLNNDGVPHNVFSPDKVADKFNLGTWKSGEERTWKFNKLGNAAILCNIHPEMEAFVVILQNPYAAVADAKGNYTIENVPPGNYTVKTWHWKLKPSKKKVTVVKGKTAKANFSLRR